ncbi:hypothetical protein ACGFYZ_14275 [Streptomyces sp. NPDC048330]|uniref:hypothetical protein n=1 Tax=Streptomyces sp. NPDC048330 TaxID=3365533 RepID=UPI0037248981
MPLITAALCVALAATACTNDDSNDSAKKTVPSATATPTPTPALTPAQAREAITNYSTTNNLARIKQNRALLDTIEGGPRYAMSLADLKQDEALPQADRKPYRLWSYDLSATDLYIPRLQNGQQRWFAAVTRAAASSSSPAS